MDRTLFSRRTLSILGVVSLMLIAGCFQPPGPPNQTPKTTTPPPEAYMENTADFNYNTLNKDHTAALNNMSGMHVQATVTIKDPRKGGNQTFKEEYRLNTRTGKYLYASNFSGTDHGIYHNSVLYYEKLGDDVSVSKVTTVNNSELVTVQDASINKSYIYVGMNSLEYSLQSVKYSGAYEVSTYTASSDVSNYALGELIPANMAYKYGSPQVTDENIMSTITVRKNGLITTYKFQYTATIFVDGKEKEYVMQVKYQILNGGPNLPVEQPKWTSQANSSSA